jgi:hypothetical protein
VVLRLLILLLIASPAFGQVFTGTSTGVIGTVAAVETFSCAANSGDTVCDNFDTGTTTCADDNAKQANCNITWSSSGCNNAKIDNQSTNLENAGSYGKKIYESSGSANCTQHINSSDRSPFYIRVILKNDTYTYTDTTSRGLVFVRNSSATNLCGLGIVNDSGLKWTVTSNAVTNIQGTGPTAGVSYVVWIDYIGNNASGCSIYVAAKNAATTTTKPAVLGASYQTVTSSFTVNSIIFRANTGTGFVYNPTYIDRFETSTTAAFGDELP